MMEKIKKNPNYFQVNLVKVLTSCKVLGSVTYTVYTVLQYMQIVKGKNAAGFMSVSVFYFQIS